MGSPASHDDRAPGEGFLVLWTGEREIAERDTQVELRRAGLRVEVVEPDELVRQAVLRAPDLVVLAGAAADDADRHAAALAAQPAAASLPIVALVRSPAGAPRAQARFGVVSRLERELAPATLAAHLRRVLNDLASRPSAWRVRVPGGDVLGAARRLATSGRCGLLVLEGPEAAVAVDADGAVAPELPARAGATIEGVFHERRPGSVRVLGREGRGTGRLAASLEGLRVVVVDDDEHRRHATVRGFERAGAQVRATGASGLPTTRSTDPGVIVIAASDLVGATPLWNDARLRAAGLLVLERDLGHVGPGDVLAEVGRLADAELSLARRLRAGDALAERLETLGPGRWLRLLGRCDHPVTLRVFGAAGRARVDLAGGRVRGASFHRADDSAVDDPRAAIDALMSMPFGRVLAGPVHAIDALEGTAGRKASVVGSVAQPEPRARGLVAEEVVVHRTDATRARKSGRSEAERSDEVSQPKAMLASETTRSSLVPLGDLAEDDEIATNAYAPEVLQELKAKLDPAKTARRDSTPGRRDETPAKGGRHDEVAWRDETPVRPAPVAVEGVVTPTSRRAVDPRPAAEAAADAAVEKPAPATLPRPPAVPAEAVPARRSKRAGLAYGAGVVVALGIGAWAAWRLPGGDEAPAPRVERAPVEAEPTAADEPTPTAPATETDSAPAQVEAIAAVAVEPAVAPQAVAEAEAGAAEPAATEAEAAVAPAPMEAPAADEAVEPPPAAAPAGGGFDALLAEAIRLAQAGDYVRSEAVSREALALSPRDARAGYRLAVALFRQRRLEEAYATARDVSEWDRQHAPSVALMADIHARRGRFGEAARVYRLALEREPRFSPAQRGLELVERLMQRREGAPQ
jgi:hypothetical protein